MEKLFKLPPFKIEPSLSIQEVKQTVGWNISAFNLPKVWEHSEGEGIKIAVLDSTPKWSPIICKDEKTKEIKILTIEEIFDSQHSKIVITDKNEQVRKVSNLFVWNGHSHHGKNWQKIIHVLRHPYKGLIKRVNVRGGLVDVTPNHSLLNKSGRIVAANDVKVGQSLSFSGLKQFNLLDGLFFKGNRDLAWLLGFFAAEGSAHSSASSKYIVSLSQKEIAPLEKSQKIFKEQFNVHSRIDKNADIYKLNISNRGLWHFIKSNCVDKNGEKRVPNSIINAPIDIQRAFLEGYNLGDGYHKECRFSWEFHHWTTKSQILSAGLLVLNKLCLNQEYSVQCRLDKPNIIQISLNQPESKKNILSRREITKILDIEYDDFVYDLETEDHTFGCGVGPIRIHNTGCDLHHNDLEENLLPGMNFIEKGKPPLDPKAFHGTHVTGIICASNNELGVVGVAPKAKVIPVKVMDNKGVGSLESIVPGVKWAADQGVDIICMSLGSPNPLAPLRRAIQYAANKGIIIFCAAGNIGKTKDVFYPACYPETVAIGSINENFDRSSFSNTGSNLDFLAPGGSILSTIPTSWYGVLSGTSQAAPWAAGVAALYLSHQRKNFPDKPIKGSQAFIDLFKKHTLPVKSEKFRNNFFQGFGIISTDDFINWNG